MPDERARGAGDQLATVARVVQALAPGGDPGSGEILGALDSLRGVREWLAEWEPRLIEAARDRGVSWTELAPALGVASRQAAERRYLRLSPNTNDPGLTREQRVQAARDQRAGDRAVASWAQANAADLRRLAGQVASLDGLDGGAQTHVDRVNDALGNDDTAALLGPLADAGRSLTGDHPTLADRIAELCARSEEIRQATRHRSAGSRAAADRSQSTPTSPPPEPPKQSHPAANRTTA